MGEHAVAVLGIDATSQRLYAPCLPCSLVLVLFPCSVIFHAHQLFVMRPTEKLSRLCRRHNLREGAVELKAFVGALLVKPFPYRSVKSRHNPATTSLPYRTLFLPPSLPSAMWQPINQLRWT